MPEKVDFKRTLDSYRATAGRFRVLYVPELQYLMVDGHGDPNHSSEYVGAVESQRRLRQAWAARDRRCTPLKGPGAAVGLRTLLVTRRHHCDRVARSQRPGQRRRSHAERERPGETDGGCQALGSGVGCVCVR